MENPAGSRTSRACLSASSGLESICGPPFKCIRSTTRAMEACARTTTSTSDRKRFRDSIKIVSCRSVSPASTASKAPSHNDGTTAISRPLVAAVSFSNRMVGSSVVRSVAATPIRLPDCTAVRAIASSIRNTGKSNRSRASAAASPIDEQVTITASAPPSRADPTIEISRRLVVAVRCPARMVFRISDSSVM